MRWTILIPHYKTWKMTLYTMSKLLQHKGRHELNVVIIDNSVGHGSNEILQWCNQNATADFDISYLAYPVSLMQSHGLAFDYALNQGLVKTDYFITVESDSFPTKDNWLDFYEQLINDGYDMAGSKLRLSGGEYIHPAGAMYKKSNWEEAKEAVLAMNKHYHYYPNLGMQHHEINGKKVSFPCHIMSREKLTDFPDKHHSYENNSFDSQLESYHPIASSVFHNGQGFKQESYLTYGQRTIASEQESILIPSDPKPTYYRMGYEPGQWFSYWHYATNKKVYQIGTEIAWMPNRVNQQQEYTLMENGFKHLWGVTAYGGGEKNETTADIYDRKKHLMEELYNSIK